MRDLEVYRKGFEVKMLSIVRLGGEAEIRSDFRVRVAIVGVD